MLAVCVIRSALQIRSDSGHGTYDLWDLLLDSYLVVGSR